MIRQATHLDLTELSALRLRSKAHWGYDPAFLEACKQELTLTKDDLGPSLVLHETKGCIDAVVMVKLAAGAAEMESLYIDPQAMGLGLGRIMFEWALSYARDEGAKKMCLTADPNAESFYARMGAFVTGRSPSGSIPNRFLPRMEILISKRQAS